MSGDEWIWSRSMLPTRPMMRLDFDESNEAQTKGQQ